MKKILKTLFSRVALLSAILLLQLAIFILFIWQLSSYFVYFYAFFTMLSIGVVIWMASQRTNPSHKLAWTIPILLFPVFGGLLYLFFRMSSSANRFRRRLTSYQKETFQYLSQDQEVIKAIQNENLSVANQSLYIRNASSFPLCVNSTTEYFPSGEAFFKRLTEVLEQARHFIFIEMFIIEEGLMWNTILAILERKASQGVDVRVMFDDAGCMFTLPYKYKEKLIKKGIQCEVFNPFTPLLEIRMNHRDHRKNIIVDGHTGFTGGINLADEYINLYPKHGHWKDTGILVRGDAVWNMTVMFFQLWGYMCKDPGQCENFSPHSHTAQAFQSDGFVQPYADSPLDNESVGEYIYLNMINRAKKYVYIFTPYLVIDNEMTTSLRLAAKSGVDVRIVTPHIPDKWYVFLVTQSFYGILLEAGVRIYEYTPGFLHAKVFVCDDEQATVGTVNLDYRSFYMHFENGVWLYMSQTVREIKKDFLETLEKCQEITLENIKKAGLPKRFLRGMLRLIAPMM